MIPQHPQCCRRRARIDVEMLGNKACRRRSDQSTVTPVGVEGDVLEDEPHNRPDCTHEGTGIGRHDDAAAFSASPRARHRVGELRRRGSMRHAVGEPETLHGDAPESIECLGGPPNVGGDFNGAMTVLITQTSFGAQGR